MKRFTEPTATSETVKYLRSINDFATVAQIAKATGKTVAQVSSAVHSLQKFKAVDCVESNERLWWFALPPEMDTRTKTFEERVPESKPRRQRKSRKQP